MMLHLTARFGRALAAATMLGAVAFVVPSAAFAATAAAAQSTPAHPSVEAHIKSLHHQLRITAAQEPQWQAVAQAMRDNAKAIGALVEDRVAKTKSMTAIDDLNSYAAIADAHAAGVKSLIPAFEALYATMTDAQKKNADMVFRHRTRPSATKAG
jgi:Spy/CpxP family protein refolding chaperone